MEPFFDGGLFELLIAMAIAYGLNFIYQRKLQLIVYSCISISAPVVLLCVRTGEIFYWAAGISVFNSILLVFLFWRQKLSHPGKSLIETEKYTEVYRKWVNMLKRKTNPLQPEKLK
jgi:hypothetical protein